MSVERKSNWSRGRLAGSLALACVVLSGCKDPEKKETAEKEPAATGETPDHLLTPGMRRVLERQSAEKPRTLKPFESQAGAEAPPSFSKQELLEAAEAMDLPAGIQDIVEFGATVEAELGKFESFSVFQTGSAIIPITLNGVEIPAGQHQRHGTCDRPPLLGLGSDGQAVPYARVGRLKALKANGEPNPDVDWVFIARRYKIRTDPNFPDFEDVAIIGSHRTSGKTAFFQMLAGSGLSKNATNVPSPMADDEPTKARAKDFWLTPSQTASIQCNGCHTNDPFIHTPYIDQVTITNADGAPEPIVPRGSDLTRVPQHNPPYSFIGVDFSWWPKPTQFKPEGNACVECHRIGTHPMGLGIFLGAVGRQRSSGLADGFASYPRSHWMPPDSSGSMSRAAFDGVYGASIDQLESYIRNPAQEGADEIPME